MRIAVNPDTGEQLVLKNGVWVPLEPAVTPETQANAPAYADRVAQGERPFQNAMDGVLETLGTVGSAAAGGIAGMAGGLWDSLTGEDYETSRATQDQISNDLTYFPTTEKGKEYVGEVGELMDNPLFNWLGETSDSWGQGANDALEDTPVDFAAAPAGILASMGPDILATIATGGAGTAGTRVARMAGSEIFDAASDVAPRVVGSVRDGLERRAAVKAREGAMAPALLQSVVNEPSTPNRSAGAAEVDLARRNIEEAASLPYPITLTQGQATRNPAQMTDEFNLIGQAQAEDVAPLANLKAQQQRDLQQNLDYVADTLDRAEPEKLGSDEVLGRSIKDTLEKRRVERKEKTGALYNAAEESGEMEMPISVKKLDDAFAQLERKRFNRTEPAKMKLLRELADDIGVSGGQKARIKDIEEFRQQINAVLNDVTNSNDKTMARILKKAIDDALDGAPEAAEAYKRARASYARDKKALDDNALVSNITGRKGRTQSPSVADEDVYRRIATGPMEDVRRLMKEMAKTEGGVNMIHTVGARLMNDLIDASRKSGSDRDGGFNSSALSSAIRKLDKSGRLDAIYGPNRAASLRKVAEVGEMINSLPYGSSANFAQSGNTMIKMITDGVGRVPIPGLNKVVKMAGDSYNDGVLRQGQQERIRKALDVEGLLSYE